MKGRIVIVGTGAGADAALSLRTLMGKRARLIGTMLRAPPARGEGCSPCRRSAARSSRTSPRAGSSRSSTASSRRAEARAAFDRMEEPGKLGKVLLDFGA